MANPVFVDCPEDVWTKVATNVTTGIIHKKSERPEEYLQMFKLTGDPAPTLKTDGARIFQDLDISEKISATVGIDVYVYPSGAAGRVRIDV